MNWKALLNPWWNARRHKAAARRYQDLLEKEERNCQALLSRCAALRTKLDSRRIKSDICDDVRATMKDGCTRPLFRLMRAAGLDLRAELARFEAEDGPSSLSDADRRALGEEE